jgi:hypothetical protein
MDRAKAPLTLVKAASQADKNLKKMEDKEHNTIKSLQKATHNHDQAVTNLHTAQSDVQVSLGVFDLSSRDALFKIQKQQAQTSRHRVAALRVRTDELSKAKQRHEVCISPFRVRCMCRPEISRRSAPASWQIFIRRLIQAGRPELGVICTIAVTCLID